MTVTKRCALCKKPNLSESAAGGPEKNWICSSCKAKVEKQLAAGETGNSELCQRCKNRRNGNCHFLPEERKKITACSDWVGKNSAHDKRRWAKFES